MEIKKNELYIFLRNILGGEYYIGLHGITAGKTDILNKYSDMTPRDKAENILKTGLINERHMSIKSTCQIFGNLALINDHKEVISDLCDFNPYYIGNKPENTEEVVVIVSVPITFKDSKGRNIFGGWMNPNISYCDDNSPFECITDKLFEKSVPPEMILGYYTFVGKSDTVEFHANERHYSNLTQEERDEFISRLFSDHQTIIDISEGNVEDQIDNKIEDEPKNRIDRFNNGDLHIIVNKDFSLKNNMKKEILIFQSDEYQKMIAESQKKEIDEIPYTFEEIENLPIEEIDIQRVKPDLNMMLKSKYEIKEYLINAKLFNNKEKTLANITGFTIYNSEAEIPIKVEVFENWIKQVRNVSEMPADIYNYVYKTSYFELETAFINKILSLQNQNREEHSSPKK